MTIGKNSGILVVGCREVEEEPMNPKIVIRSETEADVSAITEVTVAAFMTLEISNHTEQFIIEALRAAKALTISLVAEVDGRVIGHIAFSPVTISDGTRNWFGLGPVSVLPAYQRQGIGKALIRDMQLPIAILLMLVGPSAAGLLLTGIVYGRAGFRDLLSRLLKWRVSLRWYAIALLTAPGVAHHFLYYPDVGRAVSIQPKEKNTEIGRPST
jgi:predicted N-acetyltransferase YhbS